ncbi:predicted protein [Lichtheimia corymbifera JMRC:FSU:9682]|uniref:Copper transport protein n=1 Tax=Lichtheimia corymbifera JMRC:FSU:9682 TaxID=1263082 RepID=A0A068RVS3_9FUNG|nr:predicted protein [Lichtheimia corymbifera JMRC:FSU:9682]
MESSSMVWWFHPEVQGVHLLFESFVLDNGGKLFLAYIFIVAMCWTERGISYYLDYRTRRRGWKDILLRTGLYGVATTLRLWYMLITMYFNIGLFIVVVVSLTSGQLGVEYLKAYNAPSSKLYDERGYAQPTSKQQRYSHEEEQQQLFAVTDDAFELSRNSYDQRMAREMK